MSSSATSVNGDWHKRVLSQWDSLAINIGIVIGVGIFRVPADVAKYLPSGPLMLFAWLVGGLISLSGAFCYAELATMFPESGGDYVFLRKGYGKLLAFLYAWTELTIIRAGSIAAISYLFGGYACELLSCHPSLAKPLAVVVILMLALVNLAGLQTGRKVQNVLTVAKLAVIVLLIAWGLTSHGDISRLTAIGQTGSGAPLMSAFALALIPILWTYGGWQESVFVAGETKDAGKSLPFALSATVLVVGAVYLTLNATFIYLLPVAQMAASTSIAYACLQAAGAYSAKVLAILVVLFALSSINAMIITGSRLTAAMALDVSLFKIFAAESPKHKNPDKAILLNAFGGCVFVLLGSFDRLLFFTGIVVWLFFALVAACVFIFRLRYPQAERPFAVPFYPVLPACFILVCLGLAANIFYSYSLQSLFGFALVASGVPIYYLSQCLAKKTLSKERIKT